ASYGGDSNFTGSTSSALTETVQKADTTTKVSSSLNPSSYGQSVQIKATITPSTATGTVQFFEGIDGTISLGSAVVTAGSATLTTVGLSVGSHTITARYLGDSNFSPSASASLTQTVNKGSPTITVSSSLNPSSFGGIITLTTTILPSGATGSVEFFDGATSLG